MVSETNVSRKQNFTPAFIILGLQFLLLLVPLFEGLDPMVRGLSRMLGPMACTLFYVIWMFWRSGLSPLQVFKVLGMTIGLFGAAYPLMEHDIWMPYLYAGLPLLILTMTLALYLRRDKKALWMTTVIAVLPVLLVMFAIRVEGYSGDFEPELAFRWSPIEANVDAAAASADAAWTADTATWPGFRGPLRDGKVTDVTQKLDWSTPPTPLWLKDIGPGWGSMTLVSGRLFTQEQQAEEEWISCYDAKDGSLIWRFADQLRFDETISGSGPRATPTYADGRLFTIGSMGKFRALNPADGTVLWEHDLVTDAKAKVPVWGFSGSPLVIGEIVYVGAGGAEGNGVLAYAVRDGSLIWKAASEGEYYNSPQHIVLDGVDMVLWGDKDGYRGFDPASGETLWSHKPADASGSSMVQVQVIDGQSIVVPLGDGIGVARLDVVQEADGWKVTEAWTSPFLKPTFNDFFYHNGYLYGFDKNIMACIDAADGSRKWKGGRYGYGQAVVLTSVDQIVAVSERGDLILLEATPEQHTELARFPVIKGKTWNHPMVGDGHLYLRNGDQWAAFAL